jgi:hypothetical protein
MDKQKIRKHVEYFIKTWSFFTNLILVGLFAFISITILMLAQFAMYTAGTLNQNTVNLLVVVSYLILSACGSKLIFIMYNYVKDTKAERL